MAQVHESRYLTPLLPISFIAIIFILYKNLKESDNQFILLIILLVVFFTFVSKPTYKLLFQDQKFSLAAITNNYKHSYIERQQDFFDLFATLDNYDCIQISRNNAIDVILVYEEVLTGKKTYFDVVTTPSKQKRFDHNQIYNKIYTTIPKKNGNFSIWKQEGDIVKKDEVSECSKTIYLNNNKIVF